MPTLSVDVRPRRHAITLKGVLRPVRGLSDGTFSVVMVRRTESASSSIVWVLRVTVGSAQISSRVVSGPMPASDSAAATLTLAGKPRAPSRALPSKILVGVVIVSTSI